MHVLFLTMGISFLLFIDSIAPGIQFLIIVILYDLMVVSLALLKDDTNTIFRIWSFAAVLSLFQIFADWYLSSYLEVLVFPDDGLFKIGPVSGYMAGLWTIPFFMIIWIAFRIEQEFDYQRSVISSMLVSFSIFTISEMSLWKFDSWYPQNVYIFNHLAIYLVIPEILLGCSAYIGFKKYEKKSLRYLIVIPFAVMILYIFNLTVFHFIFEEIIFS